MRRYRLLAPSILVLTVLAIAAARMMSGTSEVRGDTALLMDTLVEVKVWGKGSVPAEQAVAAALAEIARLDSLLPHGLVAGSNRALLGRPEVGRLLEVSAEIHRLTGGLFDPTIGAVTRLWSFADGWSPPPPDSVAAALGSVGLERFLKTRESPDSARRFVLDLGGVAKGYAVDLAADRLVALGFESAIVSAGGDMRLVGRRPDGKPWRIAVRHPRLPGQFLGYLELSEAAVSTSGDYERCQVVDGVRYHHILDPATGLPGRKSVAVTVVGSRAVESDALSTGLFLAGPRDGSRIAESLAGLGALLVYAEGESLAVTDRLAGAFSRAAGPAR